MNAIQHAELTQNIAKGDNTMGNDRWTRDVDQDIGERGYSREYDRGGYSEKEYVGDHGSHWIEKTYRDGTIYRIDDDGTVTKKQ